MDNFHQNEISPFSTVPYKLTEKNNFSFISEYARFLSSKRKTPVPNPTNKNSLCNGINIPTNISDESKENLQVCHTSSDNNTCNKLIALETNCEVQQIKGEPKCEESDNTLNEHLEKLPTDIVIDSFSQPKETTVEDLHDASQSDAIETESNGSISNKEIHLLIKPSFVLLKRLKIEELNHYFCIKDLQKRENNRKEHDTESRSEDISLYQLQLPQSSEGIKQENDTVPRKKSVPRRSRKRSLLFTRRKRTNSVSNKFVEQTTETPTDSQLQVRPDCSSRLSLPQECGSSHRKRVSTKFTRYNISNDLLSSYTPSRSIISKRRHKATQKVIENESRKVSRHKEKATSLSAPIKRRRRQTNADTTINNVIKKRLCSSKKFTVRKFKKFLTSNETINTQETNTIETTSTNLQSPDRESVEIINKKIKQIRKYRRRKKDEIQDQQVELKPLKRIYRKEQEKTDSRKRNFVEIKTDRHPRRNKHEENSLPISTNEESQLSTDVYQENQLYPFHNYLHVSNLKNGLEEVTSLNTVDAQIKKNRRGSGKRVYRRRRLGINDGDQLLNTLQRNGFEDHKMSFNSRKILKGQAVKSRKQVAMTGANDSDNIHHSTLQIQPFGKENNRDLDSENSFTSFVIIDNYADEGLFNEQYRNRSLTSIRTFQKYTRCDGNVPKKPRKRYERKKKDIVYQPETLAALAMRSFFENKR